MVGEAHWWRDSTVPRVEEESGELRIGDLELDLEVTLVNVELVGGCCGLFIGRERWWGSHRQRRYFFVWWDLFSLALKARMTMATWQPC